MKWINPIYSHIPLILDLYIRETIMCITKIACHTCATIIIRPPPESYFPTVFNEKDTKCECVQDFMSVFVLCRD